MASMLLAALRVTLGLETDAFEKGSNTAQKEAAKLRRHLEKTAERIGNMGQAMSIGLTAPLVALGTASIAAANESAQAMGQVEAALASMGPVAGRTSAQLQKQAEQLQKISTFDDDEILRSVTANMLTFGNVTGEVFDRAQKAAVDLSVRLGQDLQSSTIQIGKALNDPIKGIQALARVGIQFTEQQKDMIKGMVAAGDTMGAQKIILGELERQFGGAAKAQRDATPTAAFKNAWDNLTETIGARLLPAITPLITGLAGLIEKFTALPGPIQTGALAIAGLVAVVGPVLMAVGGLISALGAVGPAIGFVVTGFGTLATVITAGILPAIGSLIVALAPVLVPLAAVAAAVGAVYLAWQNWDAIEGFVKRTYEAAKGWLGDKMKPVLDALGRALDAGREALRIFVDAHVQGFRLAGEWAGKLYQAVKTWLMDKLGAVMDWVAGKAKAVSDAFFKLYDDVVGHSYVPDMVDGIEKHFARLQPKMVKVATDATRDVGLSFKGLEKGIGQNVGAIADKVEQDLARPMRVVTDEIVDNFARMSAGVIQSIDMTVRSIKSGDWVGSILSVLDVITQVVDVVREVQGKPPLSADRGGQGKASGVPAFATGGSFRVGGQAGIDKNLISFRASKGEIVDIRRPGQQIAPAGGGGNTYILKGNLLTPEFFAQIQRGHDEAAARGAVAGRDLAMRDMSRARQRSLR